MARQAKALVTKPEDLNSILGLARESERTDSHMLSSVLRSHVMTYMVLSPLDVQETQNK